MAGTYHHDNFDIDEPFHRWRYVFDEETFPLRALSAIGVAANNSRGVTTVLNLDPATGQSKRRVLNQPDRQLHSCDSLEVTMAARPSGVP